MRGRLSVVHSAERQRPPQARNRDRVAEFPYPAPVRSRRRESPAAVGLGQAIRTARQELGLSQEQVGAALDLANGNFVGMVERGLREPEDHRLPAWAALLGLDADTLMELKYTGRPGAPLARVLEPAPRHPVLRKAILATELDHELRRSVLREAWGPLERLLWAAIAEAMQGEPGVPESARPEAWLTYDGQLAERVSELAIGLRIDEGAATVCWRRGSGPWQRPGEHGPVPDLRELLAVEGLDERDIDWVFDLLRARQAGRTRGS